MDFYKLLWIPRPWTGGGVRGVCREDIYYSVGEGIIMLEVHCPYGIINVFPTHTSHTPPPVHPTNIQINFLNSIITSGAIYRLILELHHKIQKMRRNDISPAHGIINGFPTLGGF